MSHLAAPGHGVTAPVIALEDLLGFCSDALKIVGLSDADALIGAQVLATTDAWGIFTHGSKILDGYLRRLRAGGLKADGRPRVIAEGGAWGLVDGGSALGMVTSVFAMELAIAKARQQGIAYVGVNNSSHFGAAGYYTWLAAREGLIGISMANDHPSVAAPGSRGAITGSNPISYAVPAKRHRPMFLDISIATVAGGKVYAARERGELIPDGWLIDSDGRPTNDATLYPGSSTLTPAAAHKGFGIALLIETLSGVITGAGVTWGIRNWLADDQSIATDHGAAFLAVDCDTISGSGDFTARVDALIDEIHAAPPAVATERLLVPGELEWLRYERAMSEGLSLPPDVMRSLRAAGAFVGLDVDSLFH
jgi:LDH2 family malate/lactate/ureidoglycolate dehydrogenase